MDTTKIIKGVVGSGRYTVTAPIVKEDYGLYLQIEGVELPSTYEVDFSNSEHNGTSVTMIGNSDGVLIPHQFIDTGKDIFAFLYHVGADYGRTVYKFRIPNKVRPDRTDIEPTPAEQSTIDQLISALNDAVSDIENMSVSAQTLAEGATATVTKSEQDGVVHLEFGIPKGATGDDGYSPTANVSKTGKVATITITDKNGTTSAQVSDGEDGTDGIDGISPSVSVTDITGGHRVVITDKDGAKSFDVEDGATGATPNLTIGTVETLEPTESATATITGTAENPVLNLGIPQGDAGEVTLADLNTALAEKAPIITDTASGAIASFTDGADDLPLKSLVVDINPVQDLHGQDSPYPAGGGKNKLDPSLLKDQAAWNMIELSVKPNTSYIASTNKPQSVGLYTYFNNTGTAGGGSSTDVYNGHPVTVTSTADGKVYFSQRRAEGTDSFQNYHFQIEEGSTATAYAPYENICPISGWTEVNVNHSDADMTNPTTLTINLGQTVYGGHLDVVSGVLTVDRANIASYNGETLPSTWISDRDVYASGTTPTTGAQVVYQLATPLEIQLDAHAINSLYGVNNIWADSGDTEVEYRADTKLFIERLTAPDSADMIADANITSGQYFMVGNSLYKATANIANGSAIVVGTNCIRKSLSEALNEINA